MARGHDTPAARRVESSGGSPDWRQLALVALAVVGLLVAALAVPPLAAGPGSSGVTGGGDGAGGGTLEVVGPAGEEGGGQGQGRGEGQPTTVGPGGGGSGVSGSGGSDVGSGRPGDRTVYVPDEPPLDPDAVTEELGDGCWVVAHGRPVPGTTLHVSVLRDREPVPDRPAWFGDRFVGRTGPDGRVGGEVPYERNVDVAVGVPDAAACQFVTAVAPSSSDLEAVAVPPTPSPASLASLAPLGNRWRSGGAWWFRTGSVTGAGPRDAEAESESANETVSATYPIEADIAVTVSGTAYPGGTVTVEASLRDHPVADGRVSVDGRVVGRTGDAGRYRLAVPADAEGELAIRVRRGEFAGAALVPVHDLRLTLTPARPLPVPGQRVVATVTLAGSGLSNATVEVAGDRVGETGENGSVAVALPAAPGATVRAAARGLRASEPFWPLFVPTLAVVGGVLLVGAAATTRAWRLRGRRRARRVAGLWGGVTAVVLGYVLGGQSGGLLGAVGVGVVGLAFLLRGRRRTLESLRQEGHARLRRLRRLLGRATLLVVDAVVAASDRLLGLARHLRSWLAAVRRGRPDVGALLRSLPRRLADGWQALHSRLRRAVQVGVGQLGPRALVVFLVAAVVVGVATWQWGWPGLAAALALLVLLALVRRFAGRSRTDPESGAGPGAPTGTGAATAAGGRSQPPSVRDLWRQFARAVAPRRWRTRTPGEIGRAAEARGLPAGPVELLTETFRAVEYGGRTPGEAARERAREAYETLRAALESDGDGEER